MGFSRARFVSSAGSAACDEIALNPQQFQERGTKRVLSTLVHEMVHLWQHHYGRPGRNGYHNREWADQMLRLGLVPRATGRASGRQTGQRVTHEVATGGAFDLACDEFMRRSVHLPYVENVPDVASGDRRAASKTRFTCDGCGQHAWAKPTAALMCGACERPLSATRV